MSFCKRLAFLLFSGFLFMTYVHLSAEEELLIPDLPNEIRNLPTLKNPSPQNQKIFDRFKKKLESHIKAADKFLSGELEGSCKNINGNTTLLNPPKFPASISMGVLFALSYINYNSAYTEFRDQQEEKCKSEEIRKLILEYGL